MASRYYSANSQLEGEIRRLKDELWMARSTIIELLPERQRVILESCRDCSTEMKERAWRDSTIKKIMELAERYPPEEMGDYVSIAPRALCPLCGESSLNPFGVRGFAFPEGLLRHLKGSHNSQRCRVFSEVLAFARMYREAEF